ncbi:MAG: NosD domain-containing protein [Candidatus Thorarchaeota archaeon]|nr:NosD domain-containing protein [Candidatus Thorarchaeota archaeon]
MEMNQDWTSTVNDQLLGEEDPGVAIAYLRMSYELRNDSIGTEAIRYKDAIFDGLHDPIYEGIYRMIASGGSQSTWKQWSGAGRVMEMLAEFARYFLQGPIIISSNTSFFCYGFPGNGTEANPYVIEGYNISTSKTCISISNTDAYFVIRNCTLGGYNSGIGIELLDVLNGEIVNNTITGKDTGIYLDDSYSLSLLNNSIADCISYGINLHFASLCAVENNTVTSNEIGIHGEHCWYNDFHNNSISFNHDVGMDFFDVWDFTLTNNTLSSNNHLGISFWISPGQQLASNVMSGNGIMITGSVEECYLNITGDNWVNGKVLGYFNNCTDDIIDGSQYGQVILVECNGTTVENGIFANCTTAIIGSEYCVLKNNTISGCSYDGLYIQESPNNIIVNNTVSGNSFNGIRVVEHSDDNLITNNTIFSNSKAGVCIDRYALGNLIISNSIFENCEYGINCDFTVSDNHIYGNILASNGIANANDEESGNHWNSTGWGNYWSDHNGIGFYAIPGEGNAFDYFPMVYPPDQSHPTINHPDDIEFNEGTQGHVIEWVPSDAYPSDYVIFRNSSKIRTGIWHGGYILVELDGVELGIHNYTLVVCDTSGNWNSDTVIATVRDENPPVINHPSDILFIEGSTGYNISWIPTDLHPDQYQVFMNGSMIMSTSWDGGSVVIELDGLSRGSYNYTIVASDTSGNTVLDTVIVFVHSAPVTSSTTTTTSTQTTTDTDATTTTPLPLDGSIVVVITSGLVIIILLIVIFLKKRS